MGRKKLLIVVGALVLVLVALQALESLLPHKERSERMESGESAEPIRPTLERPDPRTIVLEGGTFHKTRWLYHEDDPIEQADAVYTCLEDGIRREFDDNPTSSHRELRRRLNALQDHGRRTVENVPVPPVPPPPDG